MHFSYKTFGLLQPTIFTTPKILPSFMASARGFMLPKRLCMYSTENPTSASTSYGGIYTGIPFLASKLSIARQTIFSARAFVSAIFE